MLHRAEAYFAFMVEREGIRLRKEAGFSILTEDPILKEYKFTNVRRENDRTSKEFAAFYRKHVTSNTRWDEIIINCGIARYFGRSEFLISLGWQKTFNPDKIIRHAQRRKADGKKVFTGAYVITNQGISAPKEEVVVERFLTGLADKAELLVINIDLNENKWEKFIGQMMTLNGFGGSGFMAKEVTLDLIMATNWIPSDWNTWSPSGPGARRGAARVMGIDEPMSSSGKVYFRSAARTLEIMLELYELRDELWPVKFTPLRLTDIQFQLCEFDKYERVKLGQGRPRSRYHARSSSQG